MISACKKHSSNLIHNIDAENPKDMVDLKLSDLAISFKLIPLETTKESLLDDECKFFVNEKYVLAYSRNGIFKFSTSGKFLKKIMTSGRGPNEIANFSYCTFVVDEKNDLLYISYIVNKDTYLRYDLKSEHFIEPVKRAYNSTATFDIVNDSTIIVSNLYSNSKYSFYFQNLKGQLISGIKNTKIYVSNRRKDEPQISILLNDRQKYFGYFLYDDTLFQIKDNNLIPYLALNFKTQREDPPKDVLKDGDRFIYYQSGNPGFLIIRVQIVEDARTYYTEPISKRGRGFYLLFNQNSNKASKINSYTDDFIGETKDAKTLSQIKLLSDPFFIDLTPYRRIITAYYPIQIKKAIEKGLNNKDFPIELNQQLLKINETLEETDNPVLFIGMLKDKI
jgi:hypothetical protein